jgi:predicted ATP-binding protein involved in virulence
MKLMLIYTTWQLDWSWFTKYFPNIQFIVTTHSHLSAELLRTDQLAISCAGSDDVSGELGYR